MAAHGTPRLIRKVSLSSCAALEIGRVRVKVSAKHGLAAREYPATGHAAPSMNAPEIKMADTNFTDSTGEPHFPIGHGYEVTAHSLLFQLT